MLEAFKEFIARENLIPANARVLLAVSGGMDSVCMASLFKETSWSFGIVHCNFGLRGIDSDGDEYFVREWAANAEVPFYSHNFDTLDYAHEKGISIQMAARELRYDFFAEIARQKSFDLIATAHHRDDAVETFFINLIRGTGINGLRGIQPLAGQVIRPMLFASRADIEDWVNQHQIRYRHDRSNDEDKYLRNQIRHHIIPAFTEAQPAFAGIMNDTMKRLNHAAVLLNERVEEVRQQLLIQRGEEIRIAIRPLNAMVPAPAWYWELLSPFGFNETVCDEIRHCAGKAVGKLFYSPQWVLLCDREELILRKKEKEACQSRTLIEETQTRIETPIRAEIRIMDLSADFELPRSQSIACLDYDKLEFPLILRPWKAGDVFHPLGARGKKKLSDFFSDHKFSRFDKENCLLLCSGERIVWVVGHRIAHFARHTAHTKKVCMITLTED
jgi:tRNA(Ile)-lysidine synthase